MRIEPVVASVVGMVDSTHWGQVLILPHAYGVIEVTSPNALTDGIRLLSKLTQRLTQPPTSLTEVQSIAKEFTNASVASLMLLVPIADVMYVVVVGEGKVYLKRGDTLSLLLAEAGSISGEVKEGDTVLLASKNLSEVIPKEKLSTVFDHLGPTDVAEKLTLLLHEQHAVAGGSAIIFQVEKLVPTEEETIEEAIVEETAVAQPEIPSGPRPSRLRPLFSRVRSFRPHHHFPRRRIPKRTFVVAGIVLVFLISVVLGLRKQSNSSQTRAVTEAMASAQHAYEEGIALLPLNSIKGRERLAAAKAQLEPLRTTVSSRSKEGRSLANLYSQITDAITQSLAVNKSEPQLFYDASLIKQGARISSLSLVSGNLALLDTANNTVYVVEVASKNGSVIAGGEGFSGSSLIANSGTTAYVITTSGITAVAIQEKTTKEAVKKDDGWGSIKSLAAFGGNIYLLDTGKNRIWKYIATESGFSDRREYLNPDTLPDLSKATGMAIDGSVWVGTGDGKILRFTQGKENTFNVQGVEPAFGVQLIVFASDENKNIYVLDSAQKRVVVLDKEGMYLAQYAWETGLTPTQVAVSEEAKKILLLTEGKIYAIDLK